MRTILHDTAVGDRPSTSSLEELRLQLELEASNATGADLLAEIGLECPHLIPRIRRLRREHRDLRVRVAARCERRAHDTEDTDPAVDEAVLAAVRRRLRRYRAREAAVIYEAVNRDLGAGD